MRYNGMPMRYISLRSMRYDICTRLRSEHIALYTYLAFARMNKAYRTLSAHIACPKGKYRCRLVLWNSRQNGFFFYKTINGKGVVYQIIAKIWYTAKPWWYTLIHYSLLPVTFQKSFSLTISEKWRGNSEKVKIPFSCENGIFGRGRRTRTLTNGFGDRCATIDTIPLNWSNK